MKTILRILFIQIAMIMLWSCSDKLSPEEINNPDLTTRSGVCEADTTLRLEFDSEEALLQAINAGDNNSDAGLMTRSDERPIVTRPLGFVSMVSTSPQTVNGEMLSYYEVLGYDTLVPNINFAKLLNIKGEMIVSDNIVKIIPKGTFIAPKSKEDMLNDVIAGKNITSVNKYETSDEFLINRTIRYIPTFEIHPSDYSIVSTGNYTDLPDNFEENDDAITTPHHETRSSTPEPQFDNFDVFSTDKKTLIGKLIQNIIGSTKAHTVKYNNKLRLKGSFYFYNYGVYSEIGVKGWTDRKRKLNWTKTTSDELRIGWKNVLIDIPMPSTLKNEINKSKASAYYQPEIISFDDHRVYAATIIEANPDPNFWKKILANGVKGAIQFLKSKYGSKETPNIDKAEALIITTPDKIRFIAVDNEVTTYNDKSNCHVFSKGHMDITIGWSNATGVFLNNVNGSNANQLGTWIKLITDAFKTKQNTLVSGEVYICARFGEEWRGMKIIKK